MASPAPSKRRVERISRMPFRATAVVVALALVMLVAVAINRNDAGSAWGVLIGLDHPWTGSFWGGLFGVLLSGIGYALVPTVLGIWIGAVVQRWGRSQLHFLEESVADLQKYVDGSPQPAPAPPQQGSST